ncbi:MAG: acetyl-CoA C-acyltransferase [Gammaproteobacteria bacterium]|nr:acetyl-CoA C-acyltransferase [Gammaproteobacteria bacterium]
MQDNDIVIVSYARTPQGNLLGSLKDVSATTLGATAIQAAVNRANLKPTQIQEVIMGCVLPAGLGQAPARQAAIHAGIPTSANCMTINKVCGSGMKAVMLAHDSLILGNSEYVIAGGMESMTNAPYLTLKARQGYRLGHGVFIDHMMWDGLEDAYETGKAMGCFAETCAEDYKFTREDQDHYATTSLERARKAIDSGSFAAEIVPVTIKTKQGDIIVDTDEHPYSVKIEKIPQLPSAFIKNGTVTAANSSSIADGAAALCLMQFHTAKKNNIKPIARMLAHSSFSKSPDQFSTAPIDAIKLLLKKVSWQTDDVDLFEINEAFSVVTLAAMKDLAIPHEKLNVHGGGCALGHPIGATGARIIVTLIAALQKHNLKKGIAALCIGGGEATAVAIELC